MIRDSLGLTSPPRARGILALLVATLCWGMGWVATKIVLQTWPPLFARGLAGLIGAALLVALAHRRRESLVVSRQAFPLVAFAAFTNVFAWMGGSALCLRWLSVAEGVLLIYTMPIWATLFAWVILGTRPTVRGLAALALGFGGVVVLFGPGAVKSVGGEVPGIAAALGSAILFALGGVLNRKPIPVEPFALTAWQVGLGCLPMVMLGLLLEQPDFAALSGFGIWAMVYMAVFPMAICFLAWFAALEQLGPTAASTSILIVPVTGILCAALVLGERLGAREMVAMVLTLGGVILALGVNRRAV